MVPVRTSGHDQQVGISRFHYFRGQLFGEFIVRKLRHFVVHILVLYRLENKRFFIGEYPLFHRFYCSAFRWTGGIHVVTSTLIFFTKLSVFRFEYEFFCVHDCRI